VFTQVAQTATVDQRCRRHRHQHLPTMPGSRNPRGTVHVRSGIALLGKQRGTGMETHAHRQLELTLRLTGSLERAGGGREGNKESVALSVDLDAAVPPERLTQNTAMLGEALCVASHAELVQQSRRPLDVRKQEGDGARRQIAHQQIILRYAHARRRNRSLRGGLVASGPVVGRRLEQREHVPAVALQLRRADARDLG
jgi:hypothetical protein